MRLGKSLEVLERARAARERGPVGGFSAADIAIGYTVAISLAFRPLGGQPHLQACVARLEAQPAAAGLPEVPRPG